MKWFRFYGDAVNDPKVQSLSGEQFKFWVNLLCVASQNEGSIKISDLPFILRDTKANIERHISDLKAASLLVGCNQSSDHVAPYQWNKRQYKSDTSAERMRRYRDGKCDVTVTPPEQIQNRTDTPIVPKGDFDAFWKAYPKKVSKGQAIRAYDKAIKKTDHETIMGGLVKYIATNPGQYTQNAATWLNAMGWENEYVAAKGKLRGPALC